MSYLYQSIKQSNDIFLFCSITQKVLRFAKLVNPTNLWTSGIDRSLIYNRVDCSTKEKKLE